MQGRHGQESECFGSFVVLMAGGDEVFYDGSDPYVGVAYKGSELCRSV